MLVEKSIAYILGCDRRIKKISKNGNEIYTEITSKTEYEIYFWRGSDGDFLLMDWEVHQNVDGSFNVAYREGKPFTVGGR